MTQRVPSAAVRTTELRNVPGPALIRSRRQELGFAVFSMTPLTTAFAKFIVLA